jgi:hypothetical protein
VALVVVDAGAVLIGAIGEKREKREMWGKNSIGCNFK